MLKPGQGETTQRKPTWYVLCKRPCEGSLKMPWRASLQASPSQHAGLADSAAPQKTREPHCPDASRQVFSIVDNDNSGSVDMAELEASPFHAHDEQQTPRRNRSQPDFIRIQTLGLIRSRVTTALYSMRYAERCLLK